MGVKLGVILVNNWLSMFIAEREGYEPTPPYLSNSMRYQYVKALGGTT